MLTMIEENFIAIWLCVVCLLAGIFLGSESMIMKYSHEARMNAIKLAKCQEVILGGVK